MSVTRRTPILRFRGRSNEQDVDAMHDSTVLTSSRDLGWNGLIVESGHSRVFEPNDVAMAGHYLAINLGDEPLAIEKRARRDFTRIAVPPGSFWIVPAEVSFTLRTLGTSYWGGIEIA